MLEIVIARSGQPTARIHGTHIHSPYDPEKEARRFLRQSLGGRNPSLILLLGAGLGYLYREAKRSFPAARLMAVFYDQTVWRSFSPALPPGSYWHPGERNTLLQYLRSQIHELEAEGLMTVEWPPSARIFPQESLEANQALHQLFREIRGTLVTTAAMGRLWLRNSLANFLGIDEIVPPVLSGTAKSPTVIAASGPSLQEGIDFLTAYRRKIELWALPSSLHFLLKRDLVPDTVVLTDPGYYAFSHLQCGKDHRLHLTMPLSAARGSWRIGARVSLVSQNTPVERELLERAGIAAPFVPAQGTVAATALQLALRRRRGPVIFAGLDFRYRDIFSHVRPNNFENWLEPKSNRLDSLHHRLFALAAEKAPAGEGGPRTNLALDTYAGWFAEIGKSYAGRPAEHTPGKRIHRLHPSDVELPGIDGISEEELERLINAGGGDVSNQTGSPQTGSPRIFPPRAPQRFPDRGKRTEIVSAVLTGWIQRITQITAAVRATASLEPLMTDADSLSLTFLCNAAELSETRRILRLRGQEAAIRKTSAVLEKQGIFLQGLSHEFSGMK